MSPEAPFNTSDWDRQASVEIDILLPKWSSLGSTSPFVMTTNYSSDPPALGSVWIVYMFTMPFPNSAASISFPRFAITRNGRQFFCFSELGGPDLLHDQQPRGYTSWSREIGICVNTPLSLKLTGLLALLSRSESRLRAIYRMLPTRQWAILSSHHRCSNPNTFVVHDTL